MIDNHNINSDGGLQVIGAGSDFVMSGSMFSRNDENGGKLIEENGKKYKILYEMRLNTAMNTYSGGVAKYKSSERKNCKISTLLTC
jgi:GMP reductase